MEAREGSPERRRSLRDVAAGAAKRIRRSTGEKPQQLPSEQQVKSDLRSIFNTYDQASPEGKAKLEQEARKTGTVIVEGEALARGRQAAAISESLGVDRQEGLRRLAEFEKTSKQTPDSKDQK